MIWLILAALGVLYCTLQLGRSAIITRFWLVLTFAWPAGWMLFWGRQPNHGDEYQLYILLAIPLIFGLLNTGILVWILSELRDIRKEIAGVAVKMATMELRIEKLEGPHLVKP